MKDRQTTRRIAGAILAGGKAQRMGGIAKGMLPAGGSLSLIERLVVHLMRAGVEEVIIVANDDPNAFINLNSPGDLDAWFGVPNAKFGVGGPLAGRPNGTTR